MNKRLKKLQKRFDKKMTRLEEIRKMDTEDITDEIRQERDGLLSDCKEIRKEIDAEKEYQQFRSLDQTGGQNAEDNTGGEGRSRDASQADPDNPEGEYRQNITVEDQPIYRGSPATQLGSQLLDIRSTSPGFPASQAEYREARARLSQNERRGRERFDAAARQEDRAAGTPTHVMNIGSDGGYFLQGETAIDLMTHGFNNSEILPLTRQRTLSAGTQYVEVIGIDETSRKDGYRGGGIRVYTKAELEEYDATKTKFKKIRMEPTKLTGLYNASNEVLNNVTFLGQEMRDLFTEEFAFKAQSLIIEKGTGAGEALSILNAPCLVTQAKEAAQTADTIVLNNILKMETKLWSEGSRSLVYLINREVKPQLSTLNQAIGTGGAIVPLYQRQYDQGVSRATLNGLPCITVEQCSALGDKGDIILADFNQYMTATKGDVTEAMSIHVYFLYDQSTFRFTWFFDGQPLWVSAVTPYKGAVGSLVSPFITLAERS